MKDHKQRLLRECSERMLAHQAKNQNLLHNPHVQQLVEQSAALNRRIAEIEQARKTDFDDGWMAGRCDARAECAAIMAVCLYFGRMRGLGAVDSLAARCYRLEDENNTLRMDAANLGHLRKDAIRYRFLRARHWFYDDICCVAKPKQSLKPGTDCPSKERLDDCIDQLMHRSADVSSTGTGAT